MSLFTWLLLGHLVGDFLFQNDWMARNKQRSLFTLPGMTHFTIYTLCMIVALWGFSYAHAPVGWLSGQKYGTFTAIIFTTHWIIDATNVAGRWGRLMRQGKLDFVRIAVDQVFHLLIVGIVVELVLR